MPGRSAETGGRWKAMCSPLRKAMPAVKVMATRNPARDGCALVYVARIAVKGDLARILCAS